MGSAQSQVRTPKKNDRGDSGEVDEAPLTEKIIKGICALIKETGWKPDYILWELPCSYLFLMLDFWPSGKLEENEKTKDISEIPDLVDLGMSYRKD